MNYLPENTGIVITVLVSISVPCRQLVTEFCLYKLLLLWHHASLTIVATSDDFQRHSACGCHCHKVFPVVLDLIVRRRSHFCTIALTYSVSTECIRDLRNAVHALYNRFVSIYAAHSSMSLVDVHAAQPHEESVVSPGVLRDLLSSRAVSYQRFFCATTCSFPPYHSHRAITNSITTVTVDASTLAVTPGYQVEGNAGITHSSFATAIFSFFNNRVWQQGDMIVVNVEAGVGHAILHNGEIQYLTFFCVTALMRFHPSDHTSPEF